MTHQVYPTVSNTPKLSVQPLIREAIARLVPDVDGMCRFGRYRVHISPTGSWLQIDGRRWEIAFQDVTRYVSDGRCRNSRLMPTAWGKMWTLPSRQPPTRPGFRISVIGTNGKKHTDIFKTDAGRLGTRTELGLGYDIWRLSNQRRLWKKRRVLIAEVCPLASDAVIKEKVESGWWPSNKQRPAGMYRSRFDTIQAALRENKRMNGKHVYHGRAIWESKLPPPPSTVI